jgi:amino acid transporter
MTPRQAAAAHDHETTPQLRRVLTFRDLFLYYSVTGFSLRWIATGAAAGPSALVIWVVAALGFFVPLVFTVLELSSRYPEEGGVYVWSKRAFGPFAAFITGWTYWGSNLPYFPGLLYFAAANVLFVGGPAWQSLANNSAYFIAVASVGLVIAVSMNVVGLNVGKWLNNVGALASYGPAGLLVVLGIMSWSRYGSATPIDAHTLTPSTSLKDVIFWSTIAFAYGGVESGSTMGDEIQDARRTVPRAILAAGAVITVLYLVGTLAVLLAIPHEQVSGLQGIMQAIEAATRRVGLSSVVPIAAALVTINALGGVGGWFAATARLPFVAGIDRFLPPAFGRLHPRWRTPYVALLVQAAIAGLFVFLGQAGTSVRGAYDALVSMGIIAYFIPFLFMFAAMIVLQREPAGPEVMRVPGGRPMAILLASVGFVVTAISIVLAAVPPDEEPNKMLAVVKVVGSSLVLVVIGVGVYLAGRRRAAAAAALIACVALGCAATATAGQAQRPRAGAAASAPRTMRVDYYHTGNATEERFSLDRVVVEPLAWPGNPSRPIDDTNRGKYLFEVADAANERVLYSRGFSSIYGEWETTAEAKQINRTFSESLRFPSPDRPVRIVLKKRDARNVFKDVWTVAVDPSDKFVERGAASPDAGALIALHESGDPATKLDLLILGDGYTARERSKFERDARRLVATLFATSPFKERERDINVWGLAPAAAQSGISRPSQHIYRRSPIGATYDAFDSERYVLTFDNRAFRDIAANAPYDAVEILVNSATYGGGGIFGLYSTVAADSVWAPYIFVHEFGHHIAGLADEYYTSDVAYLPAADRVEPWEPNVTALLDPAALKWKDQLTPGVAIPTPWPKEEFETYTKEIQQKRRAIRAADRPESEMDALFRDEERRDTTLLNEGAHAGTVGAFEGANYEARGYFRPQADCIMFTRDNVPFCAVCRRAIAQIIDLYASAQRA